MAKLRVITRVPTFAECEAIAGVGQIEAYYPLDLSSQSTDTSGNGLDLSHFDGVGNGFFRGSPGNGIAGYGNPASLNRSIIMGVGNGLPSQGRGSASWWAIVDLHYPKTAGPTDTSQIDLLTVNAGSRSDNATQAWRLSYTHESEIIYFHTGEAPDPDVSLGFKTNAATPPFAFPLGLPKSGPVHLCVTRADGSRLRLYVNGELWNEQPFTGAVLINPASDKLGFGSTTNPVEHGADFAGVGYAAKELDGTEVRALYQACLENVSLSSEYANYPGGTVIDHQGPKFQDLLALTGGVPIAFTIANPNPGSTIYLFASSDGATITWPAEVEIAVDTFDPAKINLISILCARRSPDRYLVKLQSLDGTNIGTAAQILYTPSGELTALQLQAAVDELEGNKASLADLDSMATGKGSDLIRVVDNGNFFTTEPLSSVLVESHKRGLQGRYMEPDDFRLPNGANWSIPNPATIDDDSIDAGVRVARFADPTVQEQGVGWVQKVEEQTLSYTTHWVFRPEITPAMQMRAAFRLMARKIADNGPGGWTQLWEIDFFVLDDPSFFDTGIGFGHTLTGGALYQFELIRQAPTSDPLVGDLAVAFVENRVQ